MNILPPPYDSFDAYPQRRAWADSFKPQLAPIVGRVLGSKISLLDAPSGEDHSDACDYIAYVPSGGRIACRVRKVNPYWDWTIRHRSKSGQITETAKLQVSDIPWYLFCWTAGETIKAWIFIDLGRVRASGLIADALLKSQIKERPDGSFAWIKTEDLLRSNAIVDYENLPSEIVLRGLFGWPDSDAC